MTDHDAGTADGGGGSDTVDRGDDREPADGEGDGGAPGRGGDGDTGDGHDGSDAPDRVSDRERIDGDRPTVTVGSEGFQPDADRSNADQPPAAGAGNAVPAPDDEFDWRGWLLVGVLAVCFVVLPVVVSLRPVRVIGFRTTFLLLPLVPAFLLGATAVWVAVRSRQG